MRSEPELPAVSGGIYSSLLELLASNSQNGIIHPEMFGPFCNYVAFRILGFFLDDEN